MLNEVYNDELAANLGIDPKHPSQQRIMKTVQESVNLHRNLVGLRIRIADPKTMTENLGISLEELSELEELNTDPSLLSLQAYALSLNVIIAHNIITHYGQPDENTIPAVIITDEYFDSVEASIDAVEESDKPIFRRLDLIEQQKAGLHTLLAQLREDLNLTVSEFAQKINRTVEEIEQVEQGFGYPTLKLYNRIAAGLGIVITHDVIVNFGEDDREMFIFDEESI